MTTSIAQSAPRSVGLKLGKPRVLVLLTEPAAFFEPQILAEIEALEAGHDVAILTRNSPEPRFDTPAEFARICAEVAAFRPEVLHAHGLHQLGFVGRLAEAMGLPFTLRAHARDTAPLAPRRFAERMKHLLRREQPPGRTPEFMAGLKAIDSALCLGVLALPFTRPWLERAGLDRAKLIDCLPALRFAAFHDRSPNGDAVMHIGSGGGPKPAADILRLAGKVPGRTFNHYAAANAGEALKLEAGLTIMGPVDPDAMPGEYKKHRWLVYTGQEGEIDWPLAIAEAQAAGVGVCMPALRADLARYVGEGAGILYGSIDELPAIVSGPLPEEMRERGFVQARKSDIASHLHLLTDLWDDALAGRAPEQAGVAAPAMLPARQPATGLASSA